MLEIVQHIADAIDNLIGQVNQFIDMIQKSSDTMRQVTIWISSMTSAMGNMIIIRNGIITIVSLSIIYISIDIIRDLM